jgi:peptidoglycan/LPS O-acetylase OafA/YrhL
MRFARIYPLFALTTLVMVVTHALAHLPLLWISFSSRSLALQPLLLQVLGGLSWNYSSWSLSTEAAAYTFFVFSAGTLVTGKYPRVIAAICVAILAVLCIGHGGSLNLFTRVPALLRTIAEFSLGALLYRSQLAAETSSGILPALLAAVCVVLAAVTGWDIATVGVLAYLLYYGANSTTLLARLLNSAPAIAVGAWSYSIFLWHAPAHYAVMAIFSAYGHPTQTLDVTAARLLMMATLLGVLCLSALTFNCLEVPARRLIRRTLLHTKRSMDTTRLPVPKRDAA